MMMSEKLSESARDILVARALKSQESARARATEYRARKRAAGMTQIAIWVPSGEAQKIKIAFENHVKKLQSESD